MTKFARGTTTSPRLPQVPARSSAGRSTEIVWASVDGAATMATAKLRMTGHSLRGMAESPCRCGRSSASSREPVFCNLPALRVERRWQRQSTDHLLETQGSPRHSSVERDTLEAPISRSVLSALTGLCTFRLRLREPRKFGREPREDEQEQHVQCYHDDETKQRPLSRLAAGRLRPPAE